MIISNLKTPVRIWFGNKSIKYKLLMVIISTLTVIFLVDLWGIRQLYLIHSNMKMIENKHSESLNRLERFNSNIVKYFEKEKDYIISLHKYEKTSIESEMNMLLDSIQNEWDEYLRNNQSCNMEKYINELNKNWAIYLKLNKFILQYAKSNGNLNEMIDMGAVMLTNNIARGQLIYLNALLDKLVEIHKSEYQIEMQKMGKQYNAILISIIIFTFIAFLTAALISVKLVNSIIGPIFKLTSLMKEVEKGNLDISCKVKGADELGMLASGFNHMTGQIKELLRKIMQDQEDKRLAEIQILQHQINPHFLYHTLNSIRWMAKIYKVENIDIMVTSLIKLMKNSIGSENEFITIQNEIELLQCYFDIQKFRFIDKFEVEMNIDTQINEYLIMKLLLQPVVENALIHGIEPMKGKGRIEISGRKDGGNIEFIIRDNGLGMDEESLKSVLSDKNFKSKQFSGIGLKNVNERIKLHFGGDYGLQINSCLNVGTTVTVKIPAIVEKDYKQDEAQRVLSETV